MSWRFDYTWSLSDSSFAKDKGKVFSCFACGGGSTMGYKLAGFDVVGCNEIDPRMMSLYVQNHKPKYAFLEPIQEFKHRDDLPAELYNLDILDGSPPCSTFSMVGSREASWGIKKKFKEGQAEQVLDTLFFDFIDLAKKLQPKVVIAENVKGLLLGKAKDYVGRIYEGFDDAGYYCQHFLLDAATMGVPQRRERVFFVSLRKDLAEPFLVQDGLFFQKPKLELTFKEKCIVFGEVADQKGKEIYSGKTRELWEKRRAGDSSLGEASTREYNKRRFFSNTFLYLNKVSPTLMAREDRLICFDVPRYLSKAEVCKVSSFPQDYNFGTQSPHYVCGMSVPPVMMAQIANGVWEQWLSQLIH